MNEPTVKQKIDIKQLRKGMYVCDLDRPWLDSPFLFQGFTVNSDDELKQLTDLCEYVYVDPERSEEPALSGHAQNQAGPAGMQADAPARGTTGSRPYTAYFEDEMQTARELHSESIAFVDNLFEDVRSGKPINAKSVRMLVSQMVASILRNPDALVLLSSLRDHDDYAVGHSVNVCALSLNFGRFLGFTDEQLHELGMAALLHDIGEIRVPVDVMRKDGLMNAQEKALMESHTTHGADILRNSDGIPASAIDVALSHHERCNGNGYPAGLENDRISMYAKIVAIIDVYDSVTTPFSYRKGISSTEALKNMYNWRNELFDAQLVEKYIQCLGIYPVGSVVELNTGEVGIVISVSLEKRLQPKLMLVRDENKKPYMPPRIINLAQYDKVEKRYDILKVLEPDAYGIDLKSYLLRELPLANELTGTA